MVQFNFSNTNTAGNAGRPPGARPGLKFSPAEVRGLLLRYKVEAVCAGIVVLTGAFLFNYVSEQATRVKNLADEIQLLLDKENPVVEYKKLIEQDNVLKKSHPQPLPDNRFISYLTALAKKHNIVVVSLLPPETDDGGYFFRSSTTLTCRADNFRDVMLMMNDIEHSEYAFKVESWSVNPVMNNFDGISSRSGNSGRDDVSPQLNLTLQLSSIGLLGNEKN